jgi:ATP-dependent DNA ligase
MLARLARELPRDGYLYEPKWDGFRALVFREGDEVDIRSRNDRPLARYFPELVEAIVSLETDPFVLDGEILAVRDDVFDFAAIMARLHPAASRVERLRRETPATFVAFDVLAVGADDLRTVPFAERRTALETLARARGRSVVVTPITADRDIAADWLEQFAGAGVDGVVAKHRELAYEPGKRAMVKVKNERTADCVVGGFRWMNERELLGSLVLGLYDEGGALRHVGVVTSFTEHARRELARDLEPFVTSLEGHPWEHGFGLERSPLGRLLGAAGRWDPAEMALEWVPIRPQLVCEVAYDQVDGHRFRHPARFRRWRPDREPRSCSLEQLDVMPPELPLALGAR